MSLSCDCSYEPEPGDTIWYAPRDFAVFAGRARRTRCVSCGEKIAPSALVAVFARAKIPESDVEVRIHGEDGEIPRATWYMCEECAGLYFSLADLGYCIDISENMHDLVREYATSVPRPR